MKSINYLIGTYTLPTGEDRETEDSSTYNNMHIRAKGSLQRIFEGERVAFVQFLIASQIGVELPCGH